MKSKSILWAVLLLAALVVLCGCGEKKPVLHIYTWSDYIDAGLVEQFERDNQCRVVIDTYDSNEAMYAKLKASATGATCFPQHLHGQNHALAGNVAATGSRPDSQSGQH